MANNRLYIKCNVCGGKIFIGKHYEDGWYMGNYSENYYRPFGLVMNDLHYEHEDCFHKMYDNPYTITTENEMDD